MNAIWVEVIATRGSAPRDVGTAMMVTPDATNGTIGGGALEFEAIAIARDYLSREALEAERIFPLGPDLGQCCGGAVTLRFSRIPKRVDPPVRPQKPGAQSIRDLWLWGAGHVGRAVVAAMPDARITWVDIAQDRFPERVAGNVTTLPAADMPMLAARAPVYAHHLIFTYSHEIDLALCAALLKRKAASIGLIGSDTKRARFFRRLRALGLDPCQIQCPIGDKSLGKSPEAIAKGVAAQLQIRYRTSAVQGELT